MTIWQSDFSESQLMHVESKIADCSLADVLEALQACGFDAGQYLALNHDLRLAQLDAVGAIAHYLMDGIKENRIFASDLRIGGLTALCQATAANPDFRRTIVANVLFNQTRGGSAIKKCDEPIDRILEDVKPTGARPFFLIGDSHSNLYGPSFDANGGLVFPLQYLCTGGSAMGLGNERSKTNYGNEILRLISNIDTAKGQHPIVFKFGQVDAEFSWIFRRVRDSRRVASIADFEEFATDSVERYAAFLTKCMSRLSAPERVRVCSIFPPTLSDLAWQQGYVNAHIGFLESNQTPDNLRDSIRNLEINCIFERTQMHSLYNALLQKACAILGIIFVNDFAPLLSADGMVAAEFMKGHDGSDHHLRYPAIQPVLGAIAVRYFS